MKGQSKSPRKMKQSKLTNFLLKPRNESGENLRGTKRKIESEADDAVTTPQKKISLFENESPDLFLSPTVKGANGGRKSLFSVVNENENGVKNDFEEFAFEDFENDPFLSPKKIPSAKNTILGENSSQSSPENDSWMMELSELNFETAVKCTVLRFSIVTNRRFEQVIQVLESKSEKKGICKLRDSWTFTSFSVNDVIVVQTFQSEDGWVIDNKTGYVVVHPDILVSSTSLVSSMFCMRQGIFSSFYKDVESCGNSKMLIGRMVHELLQESLKNRSCTNEDFVNLISKYFRSPEYLYDFYLANLDVEEVERELKSFVPHVKSFLDIYVRGSSKPTGQNFCDTIDVLDIEEMVRCPNLGFQGRIDVTVKINSKSKKKVAPLELKTGKASFSTEHKSQLILYVLMLNEIGRKVESGLLLYLKEGIVKEIVPQRDEIRNLFLLRNKFVEYYKTLKINELPEPSRFINACKNCAYVRVCKSHLEGLKNDEVYSTAPIRSMNISDIKESHVDYFLKWSKMLWLEHENILHSCLDDLELDGLKLLPGIKKFGEEYVHEFSMSPKRKDKVLPGTFVAVQCNGNGEICKGVIVTAAESTCSVSLNRKLESFSDTYKIVVIFQSKFLKSNLSNLGVLMEEQYEFLRDIVINSKMPTFEEKLSKIVLKEKFLKYLLPLNKDQQKAVIKSVLCKDYVLIKGPPGTGKTETIAALVRVLLALDKTILISCHTHSSLDNILLRLADVEYLRLGALKSVREEIHGKCFKKLIEGCSSVDDVRRYFDRKVIASTCMGLDMNLVRKKVFDACIVDESSQALQPEILRPLFGAKKFILVGDEKQLPPVVKSREASKLGMGKSMFEVLMKDEAVVKLRLQYRMNSVINSLANAIAYGGMLECANEEVANATIEIKNPETYLRMDGWIKETLSNELVKSFVFIDTSQYFSWKGISRSENRRSSIIEANIVRILVHSLLDLGIDESNVGITTPFCSQVTLIKEKLSSEERTKNIELGTVDQYQGRDKSVILFSCGMENCVEEVSEFELLNDLRRLTVALTRAKHKLLLIGDERTLQRYKPFSDLIKHLKSSQIVHLTNGENLFFWEICEA